MYATNEEQATDVRTLHNLPLSSSNALRTANDDAFSVNSVDLAGLHRFGCRFIEALDSRRITLANR